MRGAAPAHDLDSVDLGEDAERIVDGIRGLD
jgi:hypothetical protein